MKKATKTDHLQFEAVMGAAIKGVPMNEAVTLITGQPKQWDALVERVIDSFGDLEIID